MDGSVRSPPGRRTPPSTREVDRLVALKVIRPELTGQPDILKRFKQELILARRITHKNVICIFDLLREEARTSCP
jgi:serine/threonine protein kinase